MKQSKAYKLTSCTCILFIILFLFTISSSHATPKLVQSGQCQYAEERLLKHVSDILFGWELYDNGIAHFSISGVSTNLHEDTNYIVKYKKGIMQLTKVENIKGTIRKWRDSKAISDITGSWTFDYALTNLTGVQSWYATLWDSPRHRITVGLKCLTTTDGPVITIHTGANNNPSTTTEQKD